MTAKQVEELVNVITRLTPEAAKIPRSLLRSAIFNSVTMAKRDVRTPGQNSMDIEVRSIVSGSSCSPVVVLDWGKEHAQMSPGDVRNFAERLRLTADAAESDAFVFDFIIKTVGVPPEQAAYVLHQFREFREERARKDFDLSTVTIDPDPAKG